MIRSKLLKERLPSSFLKWLMTGLCGCVVLILLVWSLVKYKPAPNFYGPRAIFSLMVLSIGLSLLGRILLLRLLQIETSSAHASGLRQQGAWRLLFTFDITAPLYLAAGVLIDAPAAVLTALVTQGALQLYTCIRGFVSWREGLYRVATTALLVLIADVTYSWIAGSPHKLYFVANRVTALAETNEFLGSILAAVLMFFLIISVSIPLVGHPQKDMWSSLVEYLQSPTVRFQALVLSVGPLLPVVDIFDDFAAELAWLFFLVPLCAIYYLALVSTRLSIRTVELERTLEDLRRVRQRRDELSDYASLITRVQEEERRRLARELHDDTAQALIALSLGLDGLSRAIGKQKLPEKDVQWLLNLQKLADSTLEGVRRACRDLRPSVLDDLGLRAALEWLADSSATRGVPCTFACSGNPVTTSSEAEIAIFRIVQEALSNIWRHSQATQARIELLYTSESMQVLVHDNGTGFLPEYEASESATDGHRGLGLRGMHERAMLIGAQLDITSAPDAGTTIVVSLPVQDC